MAPSLPTSARSGRSFGSKRTGSAVDAFGVILSTCCALASPIGTLALLSLSLLLVAPSLPQDETLHPGLDPHPTLIEGVELGAQAVFDVFGVASGGVERGLQPNGVAGAQLSFDLEQLAGIRGWHGDVHALWSMAGGIGAATGDIQGPSNLEAPDLDLWLSEAWVQGPLSENLELQIGKADANSYFADTVGGGDFIAGPFGASPIEFGFPTYPETAYGARLGWSFAEGSLLQVALYDGSLLEGRRTSTHGPGRWLEGRSEHFAITELSRTSNEGLTLASVGLWHSTADVEELDGGTSSGTTGGYITADHAFVIDADRRVDAFVQLGLADPDVAAVEYHVGGGAVFNGYLDARPDDTFGVGFSWVGGAESDVLAGDGELLLGAYWRTPIEEFLVLQPAIMAVLGPAGDPDADDALILGARAILSW